MEEVDLQRNKGEPRISLLKQKDVLNSTYFHTQQANIILGAIVLLP